VYVTVAGRRLISVTLLLSLSILSACGGGGGTSSGVSSNDVPPPGGGGVPPAKTLHWSPPSSYTDSTPLNPVVELDRIEIYINERGTFAETDLPKAIVSAIDPATHSVTTSFNLTNLYSDLPASPVHWVSLRAVAITGLKSEFSPPASFSF
jgi:hypothetical protein